MVFGWFFGNAKKDFEEFLSGMASELAEMQAGLATGHLKSDHQEVLELTRDEIVTLVRAVHSTEHEERGLLHRFRHRRRGLKGLAGKGKNRDENKSFERLEKALKGLDAKLKKLEEVLTKILHSFTTKPFTPRDLTDAVGLLTELQTLLSDAEQNVQLLHAIQGRQAIVFYKNHFESSQAFRDSIKGISQKNARKLLIFLDQLLHSSSGLVAKKSTPFLGSESTGMGEIFRVILFRHGSVYRLCEFFNDHGPYDQALAAKKRVDYRGWESLQRTDIVALAT